MGKKYRFLDLNWLYFYEPISILKSQVSISLSWFQLTNERGIVARLPSNKSQKALCFVTFDMKQSLRFCEIKKKQKNKNKTVLKLFNVAWQIDVAPQFKRSGTWTDHLRFVTAPKKHEKTFEGMLKDRVQL